MALDRSWNFPRPFCKRFITVKDHKSWLGVTPMQVAENLVDGFYEFGFAFPDPRFPRKIKGFNGRGGEI